MKRRKFLLGMAAGTAIGGSAFQLVASTSPKEPETIGTGVTITGLPEGANSAITNPVTGEIVSEVKADSNGEAFHPYELIKTGSHEIIIRKDNYLPIEISEYIPQKSYLTEVEMIQDLHCKMP